MKTVLRGDRIPFGFSRLALGGPHLLLTLKLPLWWSIKMGRYDPSYDQFRHIHWRPVLLIRDGDPGLLIRWGWEPVA